ncbi:type II secretion system protein, partial [Candidatus Pacearchaeota archaeon]|nr:type II secretion system protein [Candidatus Pacearchaeota archaeon]
MFEKSIPKTIRSSAFTLVELLVVISTIGILSALLIPALSKSKAQAKKIKCLSNTRQLGLATSLYADDNNFFYPSGSRDINDALRLKYSDVWHRQVSPYIDVSRPLYVCPSASGPFHIYLSGNLDYSANAHLIRFDKPLSIISIDNPSLYIMIHDASRQIPNFQWDASDFKSTLEEGKTNTYFMHALSRHSGGFITTFPDNHCSWIRTYSSNNTIPKDLGSLGDSVTGIPL